jgi:hypothetical protein
LSLFSSFAFFSPLIVSTPLASVTVTSFSSTPGSSASTVIALVFRHVELGTMLAIAREQRRPLASRARRARTRAPSRRVALKTSRGRDTGLLWDVPTSVLAMTGAPV